MENYISTVFKGLQNFEVKEDYFNEKLDKKKRALANSLTQEPSKRIGSYLNQILYGTETTDEKKEIYDGITWDKFLAFKQKFMRCLKFEWLVCGHLD